jgi:hypothetical protein
MIEEADYSRDSGFETQEDVRLGCKVYELEPSMEFSFDEGRSWCVLLAVPSYASVESSNLDLWVQPSDDARLSASFHVSLRDSDHVLLERGWKG